MQQRSWSAFLGCGRHAPAKMVLAGVFGLGGQFADAQPAPSVINDAPAAAAPLAAPPLTLQDCLNLAFEKQPALAAARASLAAAQDGAQGVNNLGLLARLAAPDLPIRRQQACLGITVAQASLAQVEWETRYAVTRNFYTIQYVRLQEKVLAEAIGKLSKGRKIAERLVNSGEVTKVTKIDVDTMELNIDLLRTKEIELSVAEPRAISALREAIGIGPDCPLDVVVAPLPALVTDLNKEALIAAALQQRNEVVQANTAHQIGNLEIQAQSRARGKRTMTFAAGADIHAKPIPQGVSNTDYRPGAIGPEMPPFLVGPRHDRVHRAEDLSARGGAVVDKTNNLVALEVENYYLKWLDAKQRTERLASIRTRARAIGDKVEDRFDQGKAAGEEYLRAITLYDQTQAQYNEALYLHALALAALERATAGALQIQQP
jgi:outer membrane protein TolC